MIVLLQLSMGKRAFSKTPAGKRLYRVKPDLEAALQACRNALEGAEQTIVPTVWSLLSVAEKEEFLKLAQAGAGTDVQRQALVVQNLASSAAGVQQNEAVQRALVTSARVVLKKKSRVESSLNLRIGRRLWRSAAARNPQARKGGRPTKTNDPDMKEKVRKYLLQNSTITAHFMKVGNEMVRVRSLSRSKRKLWKLNADMRSMLSLTTWLRHLRLHHKCFRKFKKRVDVCPICHKYDKLVVPKVARGVKESLATVKAVDDQYFAPMDRFWQEMQQTGRGDPVPWQRFVFLGNGRFCNFFSTCFVIVSTQ